MSNWALPAGDWRCQFLDGTGKQCDKDYKDRRSLRRHVNVMHGLDLTAGDRPSLFKPDPEVLEKRLEMLRRNNGSSKSKRTATKEATLQTASGRRSKKAKTAVVQSSPVKERSVQANTEAGASMVEFSGGFEAQTGADVLPKSVASLKDLDTPALILSPLSSTMKAFLTPRTANTLIQSLCDLAEGVVEDTTADQQPVIASQNVEIGDSQGSSSSSTCSSRSSCSTCSPAPDRRGAAVQVQAPGSAIKMMAGDGVSAVPGLAVVDDDGVERTRDENVFLAEGYRVLRKHYEMIVPSRVDAHCKFCALAIGTCNPCTEKFLAKMEARCGQGDTSFERFDRQVVIRERELLRNRVRPVKSPCGYCSLSQTMCAACWRRFGARELAA